ncbi:hypothetical protein PMAC_002009 [Pneumocystis sp. 'macacae']|nr:hypothetical protein PMAC_002009 [Pneumocystis sp. 'macacae']
MEKKQLKSTSSEKKTYSEYNHAISGGISGFSARLFISPFDVVKIRLQLRTYPSFYSKVLNHKDPQYCGIISSIKHIIHQEGALWKGNFSAQILYMIYGTSQFFTYAKCKSLLNDIFPEEKYNSGKSFVSGAVGGAIATIVSYPFDLLRTRFAAQGKSKGNYYLSYWGDAFSGIVSGTIGKTIVFPLDVIRKCLQVQGPTRTKYFYEGIPIYNKIIKTGIIIFKTEGLLGLYKGWAITFWVYERSLRFIDTLEQNNKLLQKNV